MTAQKVYVIESADGPSKIGISIDPEHRLKVLQKSSGSVLCLRHVRDVDTRAREVERAAHRLLEDVRSHGEWFSVNADEAIEAIEIAAEIIAERQPQSHDGRVCWTTRIAIRPCDRMALADMAKREMVSMAYLIGVAIERLVESRN